MLRFACVNCNQILKAEPSSAGRKTACPGCGQRLQIPGPSLEHTALARPVPPPAPLPPTTLHQPPPPTTSGDVMLRPSRQAPPPLPPSILTPIEPLPPTEALPPSRAIVIFALGVVSCVLLVVIGVAFWPACGLCAVTGIMAWLWGSRDLALMRAGRISREHEALCLAGYLSGMISTLVAAVITLACLALGILLVLAMALSVGGRVIH